MIFNSDKTYTQKGSSLIGVAILTLVMGFLMTGGIYLMKNYDVIQADQKTTDTSITLQEALNNFIATRKRYPCPAPMDTAPDAPGFGLEDCSITSTPGRDAIGVKIGAAPVRTLNIPDKMIVDGYGKRHIYAVTETMTTAPVDLLNGLGAIYIQDENGTSISQTEGHVTFALLSPGEDDRGAYDIQGKEILPCDTSTTSGQNCDGDATFILRSTKTFRGASDDFTHSFAFKASSLNYSWVESNWSECAGTCFSGNQTRSVVCRDKQGNDVDISEELLPAKCGHTAKPEVGRECSLGPCRWNTGAWSTCSGGRVTSGGGGGGGGGGHSYDSSTGGMENTGSAAER